jgi:hypothetical protein
MRAADLERFERRSVTWFLRLYGLALVANVVHELRAGVWRVHTGELYPWRHVPIVPLYPPSVLAIEWALTAGAGVALALGLRVRIAARVAALVTFVALLQRYSNHGTLLFLVAFYLAIDPPDVRQGDFEQREHPALGLVRAQLAIVYVFTAINKVAHGFLGGGSLENLLGFRHGPAVAASWAVVVAELALPVVLLRWPRVGIVGVAALHLGFAAWMPGLESFGLAMVAMAILFLPPAPRST